MAAATPSHTGSGPARPADGTARAGAQENSRWRLLRRLLSWAFLGAVAVLVARHALKMDWPAVGKALGAVAPVDLALAAVLAAASHGLYATFDLIGRHQTRHRLPVPRTLAVGFVNYAFNLNFGALVGGVGFRFRLYAQYGLRASVTSRVLALSILTNWVGYCLVGGALFLLRPPRVPADWAFSDARLRTIGIVLLTAVAAYLLACVLSKGHSLRWRGRSFELPGTRLALLQIGLSSCNWLAAAGIVYVLLGGRIDYALVTSVFLAAAIAGAVAHVPAGLGVLEGVFIALLGHAVSASEILAALLAYRAVYYLAPLGVAGVVLLVSRKSRRVRRARMSSRVRA
ncbi:MAG: UPF0104 family protein [Burkholderiales bacterium]|nr:UPF0104 family protein [Burkholderiales bacterium]